MANIMVVGAGIGGVPCAYELRKKLDKLHRVTLVGSSRYFEFTPSNPWIAVGWRTRENTRVDMREPLESKDIQWHDEPVVAIDAAQNVVRLHSGLELAYDYLVIATGPKLAFDEVPGLGPAGFTQSVCTHEHAARAWEEYQRFLKDPDSGSEWRGRIRSRPGSSRTYRRSASLTTRRGRLFAIDTRQCSGSGPQRRRRTSINSGDRSICSPA